MRFLANARFHSLLRPNRHDVGIGWYQRLAHFRVEDLLNV